MLVDHICTIQCTLIRILFIQLHMIDEKNMYITCILIMLNM